MDDILKRLGIVETWVAEIRAIVPHLATSADLNGLKSEIKDVTFILRGPKPKPFERRCIFSGLT